MQQQGSLDEDGGNCTEHSDCSFFDCQGECDKIAGKCRNVVANNNLQVYEIHAYKFWFSIRFSISYNFIFKF